MIKKVTLMDKASDIKHNWHLIDVKGLTLGRFSTQVARLLMGKQKVTYTPHIDNGDYVVLINAKEIVFTGNKPLDKIYYSHSGQPGGFKEIPLATAFAKSPMKVIEHSVRGMLPKNKLQDVRLRRLKIYDGKEHPHASQII